MNLLVLSAGVAAMLAFPTVGAPQDTAANCKAIHAEMVESRSTTGCKPGHASCFLGVVDGNHGLRGTTYFRGETSAKIPGSPEFSGYDGTFEYTTERGTLVAREAGVTSATLRVVTAHQRITGATGEYAGATGYFFVSGHNIDGQIVTRLSGEVCYP